VQDPDNRTDLEKYIDNLETTIRDNQIILRVILTNNFADGYQEINLEPEGNVEYLNAGETFELVLVVNKTSPQLRMKVFERGMWISPDQYGAIFQNGKGLMNY
jgi:hypothetical protein